MTPPDPKQQQENNAKMSTSTTLRNLLHQMPMPGLPTSKSLKSSLTLHTIFGYPLQETNVTIRETTWLDGLRGLAAFLVMLYHTNLTFWFPPDVEAPFGSRDAYVFRENGSTIEHTGVWRLPFLRLPMTAGHTQVSIFFVLSGFVLSWGPLGHIRAGRETKGLGSSVFRRWLRLYLPCFAISLWQCFELYFGWREIGVKKAESNIFAQVWDWLVCSEKFANPFMIDRDRFNSLHEYDWTMWTIPYEFAGSLMIFLILLAVGRFRHQGKRTLVIFGVCAYACARAEWTYWLFATGMLISSYVRNAGGFDALDEKTSTRSKAVWTAVLLFSLLLAGVPEKSEFYDRPGYEWTSYLIPWNWSEIEGGGRWIWCWAGILFILAACHLPRIRRFFEFSFMRYLGRISYMLYLTHRITLNLWGNWSKSVVYPVFGRKKFIDARADGGEDVGWVVTLIMYIILWTMILPVMLCAAHWTEVLIDAPSTRFARRVDEWFLKGSTDVQGNGSILPAHARSESVAIEMQAGRESLAREEGVGLLREEEEMREIDPRPLPDR